MPVVINGDTGITQSGEFNSDSTFGFKNRIINPGMVIDQRNAGASYTQVNGAYNLDRWAGNSYNGGAVASKFSVQRSTTAPTGFSNSMLVTSLSASATTTSDIYNIEQRIEGFNTSDLMFGTASAATITISFWVRSSLTGTFGGAIKNEARNRAYPFTYTINAANTFEYKTITIAGDTTGTWVGGTNGTGIWLSFGLGVGSSFSGTAGAWGAGDLFSATGAQYLISTNGATWYVTGVQLERGSTATSFDFRSIGTELDLCRRYLQVFRGGSGSASSSTSWESFFQFNPPLRGTPSLALTAPAQIEDHAVTVYTQSSAAVNLGSSTSLATKFGLTNFTGLTNSRYYSFAGAISGAGALLVSSEL